LKIISTGSAAPENAVTNEMFSRVIDTSDEWIFSRTGIRSRRISDGDTALSMALDASKRAIASAGISIDDIALVICATVTSEYVTPSLACLLQRDLQLREDILAFDVNAACSGFIYALGVANSLIPPGKYALLVGSEHLSRVTDYSDRATCVLFGDGAGAVIAQKSDGAFEFVSGARGDSDSLYIGAMPPSPNPFADAPAFSPSKRLHMDGQAVFKFAVEVLVKSVREVIARAGRTTEDITHYVCHQANRRIIENAAARLRVPIERFFMNIETRGNTSAASVPIALDELNASGRLRRGDSVVLAGFGGGLTYGAIYLEW
jgi:3-oxoacyl-[acyl-carrier-protein] synthase-3